MQRKTVSGCLQTCPALARGSGAICTALSERTLAIIAKFWPVWMRTAFGALLVQVSLVTDEIMSRTCAENVLESMTMLSPTHMPVKMAASCIARIRRVDDVTTADMEKIRTASSSTKDETVL